MNSSVRWRDYCITTFSLGFDQSFDGAVFAMSLSKLFALGFGAAVEEMYAVRAVLEVTGLDSRDEIG
jgi:hypothetical protein